MIQFWNIRQKVICNTNSFYIGCLLNLKPKKNLEDSKKSGMNRKYTDYTLKDDLKLFLRKDKEVKTYSEKGEVKKRFIVFTENFDAIQSRVETKDGFEMKESMMVSDMESCVRSTATKAFSNAKGFFTKSNLIVFIKFRT